MERSKEVQGGCDWWKQGWSAEEFHPNRHDVLVKGSHIKLGPTTYDTRGKANRRAFAQMIKSCTTVKGRYSRTSSRFRGDKSNKQYNTWRMSKGWATWGWFFPIPPIMMGAVYAAITPGEKRALEENLKKFSKSTDALAAKHRAEVDGRKKKCEEALATLSDDLSVLKSARKTCNSYGGTHIDGRWPWLMFHAPEVTRIKNDVVPKLDQDILRAEIKELRTQCYELGSIPTGAEFKAAFKSCQALIKSHETISKETPDKLPHLNVPTAEQTTKQIEALHKLADEQIFSQLKKKQVRSASGVAQAVDADLKSRRLKAQMTASKSNCKTLNSAWALFSKERLKDVKITEYKLFRPLVRYMGRDEVCGAKAVAKTKKGVDDITTVIKITNDAKRKAAESAQRRALSRRYSCRGWDNSRSYLELESDGSYMLKFTDGWIMGSWSVSRNNVSLSIDKASAYLQHNRGGSLQYQIQGRSLILESRVGTAVCR